jgi:hypothetical protein
LKESHLPCAELTHPTDKYACIEAAYSTRLESCRLALDATDWLFSFSDQPDLSTSHCTMVKLSYFIPPKPFLYPRDTSPEHVSPLPPREHHAAIS